MASSVSVKPKPSTSMPADNSIRSTSETTSAKYPAGTNEKADSEEVELNTRKALCVLKTSTEIRTWGTLCEAKLGDQVLHLLIGACPYSSQPVISLDDLHEAELKFSSLETEMRIRCSRDSVLYVWCAQHLKAVVFELSSQAANQCRSLGANFLKVGIVNVWEKVCMKFVCINFIRLKII